MEIRELPAVETRVETGPTQFGDDWPGVFIRGDTAIWEAVGLSAVLSMLEEDPKIKAAIMERWEMTREWEWKYHIRGPIVGLIKLLKSCDMSKMKVYGEEDDVPGEAAKAQDNTGTQSSIQSGVRMPEPTEQTTEFHTDQPTG